MIRAEARILHASADDDSRNAVLRTLRAAGFEVIEATSAEEALQRAAELPDLVILETSLPNLDGFAVAARIRAAPTTRQLPILHLLPARGAADAGAGAPGSGADRTLLHPVEPAELLATVAAILRTHRAQRELGLSHELSTIILQNIADAVTAQDPSGRVVYANDAALRILGRRDTAELAGTDEGRLLSDFEALDESGAPFDPALLPGRRVLDGEAEARAIIRWRPRTTRDERWTLVQARPVRDDRGQVILAINILHDFTEQRRAEQRLTLLSEVSAALASSLDYEETLRCVVHLLVPALADWSVLHVVENDHVRSVGCHRDPALDEQLRARAVAPIPLARRQLLPEALFSGRSMQREYDAAALASRVGDEETAAFLGTLGTRSVVCAPLVVRGATLGTLSIISAQPRRYGDAERHLLEDVAHRAALAVDHARVFRDAQLAAEVRRDLVAVVAHDLKNPLNAVSMAAALLARSAPPPPEGDRARRQTAIISRATDRMNRLINDLLDVSAIDAGRLELDRRPHPVGALVSEALETMAALAQEKQLSVERSLPSELEALCVLGDRDRLLQVFSNLIGNAIKFSDPGLRISVSAERLETTIRFTITDRGPGIADEHLPHLFDRFWRMRGRKREGTGLGLWIVKGLVEAHGGTVSVDTKVGVGSSFSFMIPLAP